MQGLLLLWHIYFNEKLVNSIVTVLKNPPKVTELSDVIFKEQQRMMKEIALPPKSVVVLHQLQPFILAPDPAKLAELGLGRQGKE